MHAGISIVYYMYGKLVLKMQTKFCHQLWKRKGKQRTCENICTTVCCFLS